MSYLFWAHIVVWTLLSVYVFSLMTKSKNLRRELETLKGLSKRDDA